MKMSVFSLHQMTVLLFIPEFCIEAAIFETAHYTSSTAFWYKKDTKRIIFMIKVTFAQPK